MTCPSETELQRLLAEQLSAAESEAVVAHVEDCPRCQAELDRLVRTLDWQEGSPQSRESDAPSRLRLPSGTKGPVRQTGPTRHPEVVDADAPAPGSEAPPRERFLQRLRKRPPIAQASLRRDAPTAGSSADQPRFVPGTKLAGRFRIVAPLGKGGMGEVYRAEDLRLGQTVALKFLPPGLANDPQRLAHFHEEVKLTRQVSHPNVCRVYDIGEADGQPFLAMEYVDGEDLASLLKRIGRLPPDKGVHIAQQLCAGLAAAHERGVIHRDLKPANIMLDGRGHVRVMDFGLARVAEKIEGGDALAGTPGYMAPEQRTGMEVTIRSDLYSLGLVLYELFTGKRPFPAKSIAELTRMQEESSPVSPSSLVPDLDPAVERVILRCLERQPQNRPASARAVAAALPGGDPLAAALAAGETPSPDMVAAAPDPSGLSPAVAIGCLVGVLVGVVVACLLVQRTTLINRAPLELPPDALEVEAKRIIHRLGYVAPPAHAARGFEDVPDDLLFIQHADLPENVKDRWDLLKTGHWPGLRFWYRQSPEPMVVNQLWDKQLRVSNARVTLDLPSWNVAGMVGVRLDPRGKLRWFRAVPPVRRMSTDAPDSSDKDLPWSAWFREEDISFKLSSYPEGAANPKRLSAEELETADWLQTPPDAYDSLAAWRGTWPGSNEGLFIEAAAYQGRPVYFEILRPADQKRDFLEKPGFSGEAQLGQNLLLGLVFGLLGGAVLLAWRNLRLGRGDRRGALRLAVFVLATEMLVWGLYASHVGGWGELALFMTGWAQVLQAAAIVWLYYIALEPLVRKIWPEALISWTRLLDGRFRDPRIGRDLLLGVLAGILIPVVGKLGLVVSGWFGVSTGLEPPDTFWLPSLLGSAALIAVILSAPTGAILNGFPPFLLLGFLRSVLRSERLAAGVMLVVVTALFSLIGEGSPYLRWLFIGLMVALFIWLMVRFGLLAAVACYLTLLLLSLPITLDSSAFYFGNGLLVMGLIVGLAVYGCFTSLSGRTLFGQ